MSQNPYHLAVRAVIRNEQGQCLLIRRSESCSHFVGKWEWPGGKVDDGETFEAALLREVREETGLEIELSGVVGAYGFEMAHKRIAMLCMEAAIRGGTFRLSDEHDACCWVSITEMLTMDFVDGLMEMAAVYAASKGRK